MNKKIIVPILCLALIVGIFSGCVEEEPAENTAPAASFTIEITNMSVTFTDTSTDADENDTLTYTWDFGDEIGTSTEASPTYEYPEAGEYTVSLTVSDGTDTDTAAEDIVVGNVAPTADFTYVATNLSVVFTDASSDPNTEDILTYLWDFGDEMNSTEASPTYVYAAAGTYNVTLTVTDDGGLSDSTEPMEITVEEAAV